MAVHNNAVRISSGLTLNLTQPNLGGSASGSVAYTDGHEAYDAIISLDNSAPMALHAALGAGNGFLMISNPNAAGISIFNDITGAQKIGLIPGGTASAPFSVVIPIQMDVIIYGVSNDQIMNIGITLIRTSANT